MGCRLACVLKVAADFAQLAARSAAVMAWRFGAVEQVAHLSAVTCYAATLLATLVKCRFNMREKPSRPNLELSQQGRITGAHICGWGGRIPHLGMHGTPHACRKHIAGCSWLPCRPGSVCLLNSNPHAATSTSLPSPPAPCRHLAGQRQPAVDHSRGWATHGVGPAQRLCRSSQVCCARCQVGADGLGLGLLYSSGCMRVVASGPPLCWAALGLAGM